MRVLATALPALLLAAALGGAAFGRPPAAAVRWRAVLATAIVAAGADVLAALAMLAGHPRAPWIAFVGGAIGSLAVWLARGRGDDGPARGGDDHGPPTPEPIDWDAFDRVRAGWRPRQRA